MFSTPPLSETLAAPTRMSWALLTIDWKPDPHKRFTPSAGRSMGIPQCSSTCRGRNAPSDDEFYENENLASQRYVNHLILTTMTWPKLTESTCSGLTPADSNAAFAAAVCSCVADVFLKAPPNVPKAVRLAPTIKIPIQRNRVIRYHIYYNTQNLLSRPQTYLPALRLQVTQVWVYFELTIST